MSYGEPLESVRLAFLVRRATIFDHSPRKRRNTAVRDAHSEYGGRTFRELSTRSQSVDRNLLLLSDEFLFKDDLRNGIDTTDCGAVGVTSFTGAREKSSSSGALMVELDNHSTQGGFTPRMNGFMRHLNGVHLNHDTGVARKKVSFDDNHATTETTCSDSDAIVRASLKSLILKLVPRKDYFPSKNYIFAFLLNARLFVAPSSLLHQILQFCIFEQNKATVNFEKESLLSFHRNILRLVQEWTEVIPYDFRDPDNHNELEELTGLCSSLDPTLEPHANQVLLNLAAKLSKLERYEAALSSIKSQAPAQIFPSESLTGLCEMCQSPSLVAQQLTHIELERLSMIGPEEFVQTFTKDYLEILSQNKCPEKLQPIRNIEYYAEWFNRLSHLVATEICRHLKKKHRKSVIEFFINVAKESFNIGNFNSLMAIFAGLHMNPVGRLKKTWAKVDVAKLEVLEHQLDPTGNFGSYRATLKAAKWRCEGATQPREKIVIPFFSLFVKDLLFLHDGCGKRLANGDINFQKWDIFADALRDFVTWKQIECPFPRDSSLLQRLLAGSIFCEKSLQLASYECEPPDSPIEKEHHKQLKLELQWRDRK